MKARPGVNTNPIDPLICMVVGCKRKALYLNSQINVGRARHKGKALGGYCSDHRHLAISQGKSLKYSNTGEGADRDPWVPICSDKD